MTKLTIPTAVFVPFEWDGNDWQVVNNIPRFTEAQDCVQYITSHPELSNRHIDWHERTEKEFIDEYIKGVGKLR